MSSVMHHGAYAVSSKYDLVQHKYGCTDCEEPRQGYAEVLEIRNAPEGKSPFVVHAFWNDNGSSYSGFRTLESAVAAFEQALSKDRGQFRVDFMRTQPGYLNTVICVDVWPWFYDV